ncbi:MAG: hypothetical protein JWM68_2002 [Verrucomicrobiales bacterium]|nr:hypothetical protein [Verrucomicrobiales bacterium]
MKPTLLLALFGALVITAFTGCETGPSIAYDPSLKPSTSPGNKIAVTAINAVPGKPIAHQSWKAVMKVKNLTKETLQNVAYEFVYDGGGKSLGSGTVPQIAPGQTVEVVSDQADKLDQGFQRIEGRVFLKDNGESLYSDRMDNWKDLSVTVAQ